MGLQLMGLVVKSDTTLVVSWRHQNAPATLKIPNSVPSNLHLFLQIAVSLLFKINGHHAN